MKVKELIKLLKTVDKDRVVAFTNGMPVKGIHGELEEDATIDHFQGEWLNPLILSTFTLEEELENTQIEVEMWRGRAEDLEREIEDLKPSFVE